MSVNIQKRIRFVGYKIYGFNLSSLEDSDPKFDDNLTLDVSIDSKLNKDTSKGFYLFMTVILTSNDRSFDLILNSKAIFETDSEIDEDYLDNSMVQVNAPAIFFPFVRAYINTVTSNAGFKPIILPAINFAQKKSENE